MRGRVISGFGRKCQHVFTMNPGKSCIDFQEFVRFALDCGNWRNLGGRFCRMRAVEQQRRPGEGSSVRLGRGGNNEKRAT
ncbi:MAG: hypothetical protein RL215_1897 [Planctomycetota bacterium]